MGRKRSARLQDDDRDPPRRRPCAVALIFGEGGDEARPEPLPLVTLGGRAPEMRWGMGSLQEIDHLPFVSPLVKSALTVKDPATIARTSGACWKAWRALTCSRSSSSR